MAVEALLWLAVAGACYLMGSLPTAYLAGRWLRGVDIRTLGDGNPGAANAYRVLGPPVGIAVACIDIGKGAAAVMAARALVGAEGATMLGSVAAVMGHNWPFFLGFRGGRGAATTLGALSVLLPWVVLPLGVTSLVPLLVTRSTTVVFAFIYGLLPFVNWYFGIYPVRLVGFAVALTALVGLTHYLTTRRGSVEGAVGAQPKS